MARFRTTGRMEVPHTAWERATTLMHGFRLDDAGTLAEIARLDRDCSYLADPHTAIGVAAARALPCKQVPIIAAATAHPAKFPDAMEKATGRRPMLPKHLADLYERPEKFTTAPARLDAVEAQLRAFAHRNAA
jgi:threonine synthase